MDLANLWFGRRLPSLAQQASAAMDLGFRGLGLLPGGWAGAATEEANGGRGSSWAGAEGLQEGTPSARNQPISILHLAMLESSEDSSSPLWEELPIPTLLAVLRSHGCGQLVIPGGLDRRPEVQDRAEKLLARVHAGGTVGAHEEALEEVLVLLQDQREAHLEPLAAFLHALRKAAPGLRIAIQPEASAAGLLDPHHFRLLLGEIPDLQIGYWHDTALLECRRAGGLEEPGAWLDGFANLLQGSTLHDFQGGASLQPPGLGQVEWELLREYLPRSAKRILALAPSYPGEVLVESRTQLQARLPA